MGATDQPTTPGAWKVNVGASYAVVYTDTQRVARTSRAANPHYEQDAHLIAAAPDLYAALEDICLPERGHAVCTHEGDLPQACVWCAARAALAKATGQEGGR